MSYDISVGVKVEDTDLIAEIRYPEYANPTYNLGEMFRACTGWDYNQGEWYRVSEVFDKICNGITELLKHPKKYRKYEPDNGWGTISSAIRALGSMRDCINDTAQEIPIEYLWVKW